MSLPVDKALRKAQSHIKAGELAEAEEFYKTQKRESSAAPTMQLAATPSKVDLKFELLAKCPLEHLNIGI